MKIKFEIKNRWTGEVLFEYEKENNNIKDTVVEAVKSGAYLGGADLRDANLGGADLGDANLRGADLRGADLRDANLRGADLSGAYLRGADLRGANLGGAYLSDAYLSGAYLSDVDLRGAYLRGAYLRGADLSDAKNIPYIPIACPTDGAFIGWKKVHGCLVKLEVPEDARRCSATSSKCRCDKALVLEIRNLESDETLDQIINKSYSPYVIYKVGEMVFPDSFDEDRWNECSHGIHFFIDKSEAINY